MKFHPIVPTFFLIGIFINSLGRLILSPLHYPAGLKFTTVGYMIWAVTYLYVAVSTLLAKQFNRHIAFWSVFTILAPIQFSAARNHNNLLNHTTATILISQLIIGTVWEAQNYRSKRKFKSFTD